MADIRINALATTAASTASDDFLAVDGSSQGTRKLNAFSPTFGGNLTVSGTATIGSQVTTNGASAGYRFDPRDGSGANWLWYNPTGDDARLYNTSGAGDVLTITNAGAATLAGNLTVSGTGNSSVAGNLGVGGGTTLTSFDTAYSASQVTGSLSLLGDNVAAIYGNNIYYNAGWKYSKASYVGLYVQNNAGLGDHAWYTAGSGSVGGSVSLTQALTLKNGGNLLIGKTTPDTGEKLQVAGGIAATGLVDITGPDNSGANGVGNLKVYAANRTALLTFNYQNINASGALLLSTAGTTALTLDSSQRTILSGALRLANSYVATPQVSTGYVTIQDSTGTTYKVLVAP